MPEPMVTFIGNGWVCNLCDAHQFTSTTDHATHRRGAYNHLITNHPSANRDDERVER
jgi:hypothetical protein